MTRTGYDLSNYQGNLPASGIVADFAYILATDGDTFKNPYAPQQAKTLRAQGVRVGWYHFFRPSTPVSDQLLNFYSIVSTCGGSDLPLALDSETSDPLGWQHLASAMMNFAMNVESWTNYIPNPHSVLYCNLNFYNNLVPYGFPWGRWVWLADPSDTSPSKPCLIWQQAPRAVSWEPGPVDPDTFMGTDADWANFINHSRGPSIPGKDKDMAVICNVDNNGGQWLLSGDSYTHINDAESVNGLLSAGVGQGPISEAFHQSLLATTKHS